MRGQKVMLDRDLAKLYGVKTKDLNKAVRRNPGRFPPDFLLQLTKDEAKTASSRFQIGTMKRGQNIKYLPQAFTENGIAMLSSVLRSERAIQVNIQIMRVFTRSRELLATHKDLAWKLGELEHKFEGHDDKIALIFDTIRKLISPPNTPSRRIGFQPPPPTADQAEEKPGAARRPAQSLSLPPPGRPPGPRPPGPMPPPPTPFRPAAPAPGMPRPELARRRSSWISSRACS
jgi:hypothetical protein